MPGRASRRPSRRAARRSRTSSRRRASARPAARASSPIAVPAADATVVSAAPGRGRDRAGQAEHARVRLRARGSQRALRPRAQSVGPARSPRRRRLVLGLGRRRRGGPGARSAGLRHRRLDPHPGVALRHHRPQADLRASEPGRACCRSSWSMDHAGPMARTRRGLRADAAARWRATTRPTPRTSVLPVPDYTAALTGDVKRPARRTRSARFFLDVGRARGARGRRAGGAALEQAGARVDEVDADHTWHVARRRPPPSWPRRRSPITPSGCARVRPTTSPTCASGCGWACS